MPQLTISEATIQKLLDQIPSGHLFAGITLNSMRPVVGGCIHHALCLDTNRGRLFLKINSLEFETHFSAEADGLNHLAPYIRVPNHAVSGVLDNLAFLLMEWLELSSHAVGARAEDALGEQIAALHSQSASTFGLGHDNFIGASPQRNVQMENWAEFFATYRLQPQLDWAEARGLSKSTRDAGYRLLNELNLFFTNYHPAPSLIHGDLWGGNHGFLHDGTPVLFDPAIYYADREAEIAMTELFGGFSHRTRQAYESIWPLDAGYAQRRNLYNLYHILNHYNLFGGGYGQQANRLIRQLLSEVRA
jgi:protein-ribulosamine 3-kinase